MSYNFGENEISLKTNTNLPSPSPSSSSIATNETDATSSSSNQPRTYRPAPVAVKSSSSYVDRRTRNNAAVKRFRSRTKNMHQSIEDKISRYSRLTKLFDCERERLEQSRKALESLVQLQVQGVDVSSQVHDVVQSEDKLLSDFKMQIAEELSDEEGDRTS